MVRGAGRKPFFCTEEEHFAFEFDLHVVHGADDVAQGLTVNGSIFLVECL